MRKSHQPILQGNLAYPIAEIRGVFLLERTVAHKSFAAYSPPGHLVHLVTDGEVVQRCNDREYRLRPGDMLWYHENEFVEGTPVRTPWRFYSVIFHAPELPPPDFSRRMAQCDLSAASALFAKLIMCWRRADERALARTLRCHAALAELLLLHRSIDSIVPQSPTTWLEQIWWNIENQVRQKLGKLHRLDELAELGNTSPATVHRASMEAVGMSPVKRIKRLRLEMARGLLVYSRASISEIAEQAGYERVNEFSRDIRKEFGVSPSLIRKRSSR